MGAYSRFFTAIGKARRLRRWDPGYFPPFLRPVAFTRAAPGCRDFDAAVAAYLTLVSNDRSGWSPTDRDRDHFSHAVDDRGLCDLIDPRR